MNKDVRISAVLLGMAIWSVSSVAQAGSTSLSEKTDRFTGIQSISWNSLPDNDGDFAFATSVAFSEVGNQRRYDGQLITYGDVGRFTNCNWTYWLLDGRKAPEIQTEYKSSHISSATIERFVLTDPEAMLPILAAAKRVEFRVCNTEGQISGEDLGGIRKVLERASEKEGGN